MPGTVEFPKQFISLTCAECRRGFDYPVTRSNNYSKYCLPCRKARTAANKRRFDERRSSSPEGPPSKDVYSALKDIPDYVMHPSKIVDAAIRECSRIE